MTILEQFLQRQQASELLVWAHLSLLAVVPLALALTMAGLAVGDPLLPSWLEIPILAFPIIAYTVWQQWQRPFYPFSLGFVYQAPEHLTGQQKQILAIVKRPATGWIAVFVGVLLYAIFRQLYVAAPLAAEIAPFPASWRFLGVLWALVFFLVANVCAQLGVVALRLLVLPPSELQEEYDPQRIKEDFTVLGVPRKQLWSFTSEKEPNTRSAMTTPPAQTETSSITPEQPTAPEVEEAPESAQTEVVTRSAMTTPPAQTETSSITPEQPAPPEVEEAPE
ncbi:MAG: low-complexity tail membrane protein, partial [Pseudanabaenaceae cyanobacterium]